MASNNRMYILLIEDNPLDIVVIRRYLEEYSNQYVLLVAGTLADGLQTLRERQVDLILLDLSLPDSSGFRTLTNFLNQIDTTPVVVLTGTKNEIIGDQSVKAGAQDYLVKGDFDGRSLMRSIRYAHQRFRAKARLESALNRLARNKDRYEHAEQMMHFGYLEMDIVSNQMDWTDELYRIFGTRPQSFQPTLSKYLNYVHPEDKEIVRQFFLHPPQDGSPQNLSHRIIVDGKRIKQLALYSRTRFDRELQQYFLAVTILDLSHEETPGIASKATPSSSQGPNTQPRDQEWLSQLGFLVRTPLTSALHWSYLLKQQPLSPPADRYLEGLHQSLQELAIATHNLLHLTALNIDTHSIREETFRLEHLLNSISALFSGPRFPGFQWNGRTDAPGFIRGDIARITHIIYALGQFILAHQPASRITTQLADGEEHESATLHFSFPLSAQQAKTLKQLQPAEGELLLPDGSNDWKDISSPRRNLPIAFQMIKNMNGHFDFHSARSRKGRRLEVSFPCKWYPHESYPGQLLSDQPYRILVVEDHQLNRLAIRRSLLNWNDNVEVVDIGTGAEAMPAFQQQFFDLVLMDLQLPDTDGWEVAKQLKNERDVPIIAMSANRDQKEIYRSRLWGFDAYLSKPFFTEELFQLIQDVLQGKRSG